jgi:hypothetical protein
MVGASTPASYSTLCVSRLSVSFPPQPNSLAYNFCVDRLFGTFPCKALLGCLPRNATAAPQLSKSSVPVSYPAAPGLIPHALRSEKEKPGMLTGLISIQRVSSWSGWSRSSRLHRARLSADQPQTPAPLRASPAPAKSDAGDARNRNLFDEHEPVKRPPKLLFACVFLPSIRPAVDSSLKHSHPTPSLCSRPPKPARRPVKAPQSAPRSGRLDGPQQHAGYPQLESNSRRKHRRTAAFPTPHTTKIREAHGMEFPCTHTSISVYRFHASAFTAAHDTVTTYY